MEESRPGLRDRGRQDVLSDPGTRDLLQDGARRDLRRDPGRQDLLRDRGVIDGAQLEAGLANRIPDEITLARVSGRSGAYAIQRRRE